MKMFIQNENGQNLLFNSDIRESPVTDNPYKGSKILMLVLERPKKQVALKSQLCVIRKHIKFLAFVDFGQGKKYLTPYLSLASSTSTFMQYTFLHINHTHICIIIHKYIKDQLNVIKTQYPFI